MTVPTRFRETVVAIGTEEGWGGGSSAPVGASYVVLGVEGTLTAERVLTAGHGIDLPDLGAGSTVTIDVDEAELAAPIPALVAGTWAGAASITTLGTVSTGTWQGTAIAAAYLGTHTHAAADITSGVLATARLGSGTATGAVLINGVWTSGTTSGHVLRWDGSAWAGAALSAADISAGAVSVAARLGWLSTTSTATTTDATNGTTTNCPSFSVTTGKTYMITILPILDTSASTNGWRCRFEESGGASSSQCIATVSYPTASGVSTNQITAAGSWTTSGTGNTSRTYGLISLMYTCTGTGTLKLAIRPETAGGTINLYSGTPYQMLEM